MLAFFDSGYGGLSIFSEVQRLFPRYDYLYLGDNARAPYGERSPETIKQFCREAVEFLFKKGATLVIFACNTASSVALRDIQEEYIREAHVAAKNILGVIRPMAEEACTLSKNGKVGVVGTRATINSHALDHEIKKINPAIQVFSQSCPLLVPLIEEGFIKKPETRMILKKYTRHLKDYHIDTLVLACTHYAFLLGQFQGIFGKKVHILHPGLIVGKKLGDYLYRHPEIEQNITKGGSIQFFTSEYPGRFHEIAHMFTKIPLEKIKHVNLVAC